MALGVFVLPWFSFRLLRANYRHTISPIICHTICVLKSLIPKLARTIHATANPFTKPFVRSEFREGAEYRLYPSAFHE